MSTSTADTKLAWIEKILIGLLLVLILVSVVNRIFSSPFDFDEGVNLILSKNFITSGRYATFDAVFDPVVTLGPTVVFPAAILSLLNNPFLPRLVILFYSLALIFVVITRYLRHSLSQLLFLVLVCLTPYYYYFSSHVLGEIPALFFAVTGLYLLSNQRYLLSGTFLALSIVTKNVFFLSIFPALYLLYIQGKNFSPKKRLSFIAPFIFLAAIWEIYRFASLDFSFQSYFTNIYDLIRYTKSIVLPHANFFDRLNMLSGTFGIHGLIVFLCLFGVSLYTSLKTKTLLKSIAIFTLTYLSYYFFLGSSAWYRHFFPAIILFIILLSGISAHTHVFRLLALIFVTLVLARFIFPINNATYLYQQNLLPLFDQTGNDVFSQSNILKQQIETANYISSHLSSENISGVVWYNAPEISYLCSKPILRNPEDKNTRYLISHPFGNLLVPSVDARISEYPSKTTIFTRPFYKIYKKND